MSEEGSDRRQMSLRDKLSLPEASEPPWSLASAALIVCAMFVCLAIIGPALVAILSGGDSLSPFDLMLSWTIGMALTAVFVLLRQRSSEESWRALRLTRGELALPLALITGLAIGLSIDLFINLADGRFLPLPQIWGFQTRGVAGLTLAALLLVVLAPLAETLVFHAVLLPRLRWRLGSWPGVVATAGVYTILHYLVFFKAYDFYHLRWHGVALPMLIGIAFGVLKVFSQSSRAVLAARMSAGLMSLLTAVAISVG